MTANERLEQPCESSISERFLAGAGISVFGASALVVAYYNPSTAGFFPVCPLHALTGLNCPGCGLTRGLHALFLGDVSGALHFNALLPVYLFIFVYLFAAMFSVAARGRALNFSIFRPTFIWSFFVVALVFGVVRNFPVYPFTLLAP